MINSAWIPFISSPPQVGLDLTVRRFRFDFMGVRPAGHFTFWDSYRVRDPLSSSSWYPSSMRTRPPGCGRVDLVMWDAWRLIRVVVKRTGNQKKTALCSSLGTFVLAGQGEATD